MKHLREFEEWSDADLDSSMGDLGGMGFNTILHALDKLEDDKNFEYFVENILGGGSHAEFHVLNSSYIEWKKTKKVELPDIEIDGYLEEILEDGDDLVDVLSHFSDAKHITKEEFEKIKPQIEEKIIDIIAEKSNLFVENIADKNWWVLTVLDFLDAPIDSYTTDSYEFMVEFDIYKHCDQGIFETTIDKKDIYLEGEYEITNTYSIPFGIFFKTVSDLEVFDYNGCYYDEYSGMDYYYYEELHGAIDGDPGLDDSFLKAIKKYISIENGVSERKGISEYEVVDSLETAFEKYLTKTETSFSETDTYRNESFWDLPERIRDKAYKEIEELEEKGEDFAYMDTINGDFSCSIEITDWSDEH